MLKCPNDQLPSGNKQVVWASSLPTDQVASLNQSKPKKPACIDRLQPAYYWPCCCVGSCVAPDYFLVPSQISPADARHDPTKSKPIMHFNSMKIPQLALLTAAALILAGSNTVRGQSIYVPNADFGSPVVPYEDIALPEMISWEPVETPLQQSNYEIGVFVNNPAYTNDVPDDYIYNCDGTQAAYIFSDYGLAILQDYDSVDSTGGPPSHAFNATYDVGKSYQLRAGLIASADFGQLPGVIMQMSLYYRDSSSNMVTIASSNVVFTTNVFTSITNFVTFELDTPPVQTGDAWAGQHIGIQFLSVIPENLTNGGYWDLGNVQLAATPALINPMWSNGHFGATLLSQPGLVFQILTTTNLSAPLYLWSNVITVTNTSGTTSFVDPSPSYNQRFYQARQVLPPRS